MDEYMGQVLKGIYEIECLETDELISRGLAPSPADAHLGAHGARKAGPGDYAYSWKLTMTNDAPTLLSTDHFATDYTLRMICALYAAFYYYRNKRNFCLETLKTMDEQAKGVSDKSKEVHSAESEAKHQLILQVQYQSSLQDQAKRAIQAYRGTAAGRGKERDEWQHLVGLAASDLFSKGLAYKNAKRNLNIMQKAVEEKGRIYDYFKEEEAKARNQLQQKALPEIRYVLGKIQNVFEAMKAEKGEDER